MSDMMHSYRVLIVDDDAVVCAFIERVCIGLGWETDIAANGEEALAVMRERSHQIFVLDVKMPGPAGIELSRQVQKYEESPAILILTGHAEVNHAVQALKEGVFDYIQKGEINLEIMEHALQRAAEYHENRQRSLTAQREREKAFQNLDASNKQFQAALDLSNEMILICEARSGRIQDCNVAAHRRLGYTREELLSLTIDTVDGDFSRTAWDAMRERAFSERVDLQEKIYFEKSGNTFPVEVSHSYVCLETGERITVLARDISERKRMERRVILFQTLVNQSNDAIFVLDFETGGIMDCNDQACESLGYARQELLEMNITAIDEIFASGLSWEEHREEMRVRKSMVFEGRHKRKDGTIFPVEVSLKFTVFAQMNFLVGIVRDVTAQKQAQRTIEEAKLVAESKSAKLRSVIEGMEVGVLVANENDEIAEVNGWFAEFCRMPRELIVGRSVNRIVRDLADVNIVGILDEFKSGFAKRENTLEAYINGIPVLLRFQPVFHENLYRGVIVTVIDVSELVGEKEKAEEKSRFKSEFLAKVSAEIRTPLDGIVGLTDMLLGTAIDAEQRTYLEMVKDCAGSVVSLLSELEDLSRIEMGTLEPERSDFCVREVMKEAIRVVATRASRRGMRLVVRGEDVVPPVLYGYGESLGQILAVLCEDAIKHCGGESIILDVREEERVGERIRLGFVVGSELPDDVAIGVEGDKVRTDYPGMDVRASLLQSLVENLEGELWMEGVGGSSARICFRAWFGIPEVRGEEWGVREPIGLKVLIVEDSRVSAMVAQQLMRKLGCHTTAASNGREALQALRRASFDFIMMDIEMPEMDGLEAARAIRANPAMKDVPIIAMTAHVMQRDREKCLEAGMNDFITKPIGEESLRGVIGKWGVKNDMGES
ncbi:MAG: response regulator [Candidatus Omnitrophota bacterium]|nr:MAG: response regulator [Candidatus Omnitrophota bacterium]